MHIGSHLEPLLRCMASKSLVTLHAPISHNAWPKSFVSLFKKPKHAALTLPLYRHVLKIWRKVREKLRWAMPFVLVCVLLTAIIVVHETGHFLAASLQGIHVTKFAVGFGPILAKVNANNVEYSIRAFPLGGFVGFPDDNDPKRVLDENLMKNRPMFDRVLVISAGVIANIVFAYLIIFLQVLFVGFPVEEVFNGVVVSEVMPLSVASRGGLIGGDVIVGVNDLDMRRMEPNLVLDVCDVMKGSPKRSRLLKVLRGGKYVEVHVTPDENSDGTGRIGVQLEPSVTIKRDKPGNLLEAFRSSGREFWGLASIVLESQKQFFLNFSQSASKVVGPVGFVVDGAEVVKSNTDGLYRFAAILNINQAVVNLVPLPPLDGGLLALILIEAARGGKKLPLEIELLIRFPGSMFFLVLSVFLLVRDTLKLHFVRDLLRLLWHCIALWK